MPGPTELAIILVLVLIVFGAGKLPQVFEALGDGLGRFRRASEGDTPIDVTPRSAQIDEDEADPAGRASA